MENQPRTGNGGVEALTDDDLERVASRNAVMDAFNRRVDAGDADSFYEDAEAAGIYVESVDDMTDEQCATLVNFWKAGDTAGDSADNPAAAATAGADTVGDKKKRRINSKSGKKGIAIAAATAVLGGTMMVGGVVGFNLGKKADKSSDLPPDDQNRQEDTLPSDNNWTPTEMTPTGNPEDGEQLEKLKFLNDYRFYEDARKAVEWQRSSEAFCGQELVGTEVFKTLDEETQEKIRQGDEGAKEDLFRKMMEENMISASEVAVSYTFHVIGQAEGKYFKDFFDGTETIQQIRERIANMTEEEQDAFLREWRDVLDHATFETVVNKSYENHNHLIEKTTEDGKTTYELRHCTTNDYGAEIVRIHFKDKDENGNWIDKDLVTRDIKANFENIEVSENDKGETTLTFKDSHGRVVYYCMQMIVAYKGEYKIVVTIPDMPTPPEEHKNPDAAMRNAGPDVDPQPAGDQSEKPAEEEHYDSDKGQGDGTEEHQEQSSSGSGDTAEGSVDSSETKVHDNDDQTIDQAIDNADKSHNDDVHKAPSGGSGSSSNKKDPTPTPKPPVTQDNHQGQDDANKKAREDRAEADAAANRPASMDEI